MTDILVHPLELRNASQEFHECAQKIGQSLSVIDNIINSLKTQLFLGNRADALQNHYKIKREALERAQALITHFASELQTAADVFEKADLEQILSQVPVTLGPWKNSLLLSIQPIFPPEWIPKLKIPTLPFFSTLSLIPGLEGDKGIKLPEWLDKRIEAIFHPVEIPTPLARDGFPQTSTSDTTFGELLKNPPVVDQSKTPMPEQTGIAYEVPVKSQGSLYGSAACAPTSVSMVLDCYHSKRISWSIATKSVSCDEEKEVNSNEDKSSMDLIDTMHKLIFSTLYQSIE